MYIFLAPMNKKLVLFFTRELFNYAFTMDVIIERWMIGLRMNNNLEWTWKEMVVV
jgi:hypothetical protein